MRERPLSAFPGTIARALEALDTVAKTRLEARATRIAMEARVRAPRRQGELASSIGAVKRADGPSVRMALHGHFQDVGTKPHVIAPLAKGFLAWPWWRSSQLPMGMWFRTTEPVRHPGTRATQWFTRIFRSQAWWYIQDIRRDFRGSLGITRRG